MASLIHPTAEVSDEAEIGDNCKIWHQAQIRERAKLGSNCVLGKGVYIDIDVIVGDNCKIQNGCSVYRGVVLEDGVFLGPGVILTNDKTPRALNPQNDLKTGDDWEISSILIKRGASLGAGSIVVPGVIIGEFALVGAGAVVTKEVPPYGLVVGVPARLVGWVDAAGHVIERNDRL